MKVVKPKTTVGQAYCRLDGVSIVCQYTSRLAIDRQTPNRLIIIVTCAQDMQQLSVHEGGRMNHGGGEAHKHKAQGGGASGGPSQDKPPLSQNKGNGQRPLLGPR